MGNYEDEKEWKKANRPSACTKNPIEFFIPYDIRYETMRKIKQECLEVYGRDISTECTKRKVCLTKKCLGRELPWESETAKPYLEKLKASQEITNDLLYVKTDCSTCSFAKSCSSPCFQVTDYMNKDKSVEPPLVSKAEISTIPTTLTMEPNTKDFYAEMPWDSLSDKRKQVIKLYMYERRDFKFIAEKLDLNNQARAKYEYYAALTTMSEYATVREFIRERLDELTDKQQSVITYIYIDNNSILEASDKLGISKQAAQQMVSRIIDKYEIKWPKFVWKKGNKVIYNVPEVLK